MDGTESLPHFDQPLWAALSNMQLPAPHGAASFPAALCAATGWSEAFAARATAEYRRFLFLVATSSGELTPSRAVDEVWHLHLATDHYAEELCGRVVGRPLEHVAGEGDAQEEERFRDQYATTLKLYEAAFGQAPPEDVWPRGATAPPERGGRLHWAFVGLGAAGAAGAIAAGLYGTALGLIAGGGLLALLGRQPGASRGQREDHWGSGGGAEMMLLGADGGAAGGHGHCSGAAGCSGSCGGGSCSGGCGGH